MAVANLRPSLRLVEGDVDPDRLVGVVSGHLGVDEHAVVLLDVQALDLPDM
jgi:hypothetical protein